MKRILLLIAIMTLFPLASLVSKGTEDKIIPNDEQVLMGKLDNGMTYYLRRNQYPENRAVLRLAVNTGSVLEDENQQGLAHFVEHMAFNGTEKYSKNDLIYYLESLGMEFGADINAHTSFDETVYKLQVRTDIPEQLITGFDVLNQWAFHQTYDHEEIDKERGVVLEEWRIGRGARARMMDKAFPVLFHDSKYGLRLPIGKEEILRTFQYSTLKKFYEDWYRPELMAIVAVGDFDLKEMESLIKDKFSTYDNPEISRMRDEVSVPSHDRTLFSIQSDKEASSSVVELFNKYEQQPMRVIGDYKDKISKMLYYSMLNSRLGEIAQKENPPFINAFAYTSSYAKAVSFSSIGAFSSDDGLERSLESILIEAYRAKIHGFSESEISRAKKELLSRVETYYRERDNLESIHFANDMVDAYLNGSPIPSIEFEFDIYNKMVPLITLEEVRISTKDLLSQENRVVLITTGESDEIIIPTEESVKSILASVENQEIKPFVDDFVEKELIENLGEPSEVIERKFYETENISEWILGNGIKIVLKPTDFKKDAILFTSYSPGGTSQAEDENYLSALFATSTVTTGGMGSFSSIELEKQLAGKQVSLSPYISDLKEGFEGSSTLEDLETMFQLLYMTATSPREDRETWNSFIERVGDSIKNKDSNPKQQYYDLISKLMTSDHYRSQPLKKERLVEVDQSNALSFYKDRFSDFNDFTFFFTGSFELEKIEPLIVKYIGALPSTKRKESWIDRKMRYKEGQIKEILQAGIEPVSMVTLIYSGNFQWSREELYKMISLESVLQTQLTKVVREEASGVYGIGVRFSPALHPVSDYNFRFSFTCDPERQEELTSLVKSQINNVQKGIFDDQIVLDVKEAQLVEYEESLEKNQWWLNQIVNVWYYDYPIETILNKKDLYQSLTKSDITQVATKYLSDINLMEIILIPESE